MTLVKLVSPVICGGLLVFLIPYIHLGIVSSLVYSAKKPDVDVANCVNECWDTKFKGDYETLPAAYKHIYFNLTPQVLKIWFTTVVAILALYETIKRIVNLLQQGKLRLTMLLLFGSVVYSHYYAWWSVFNYLNDDFYKQWYHQMYFTITELISTILVIYLLNKDNHLHGRMLLIILGIALFHIITSSKDQFIENLFWRGGEFYQICRDIGFMIPDLMHVAISGYGIFVSRHAKSSSNNQMFKTCFENRLTKLDYLCTVLLVSILYGIVGVLPN